jgi:hypothetical protein
MKQFLKVFIPILLIVALLIAASWFLLTMVTRVFGVRGVLGDLEICPNLVKEQFDADGLAGIKLTFAGRELQVTFRNPERKDAGEYSIKAASCNGKELEVKKDRLVIRTSELKEMDESGNMIEVVLG